MFGFLAEKFSSIFSRISGKHALTENNMQEALEQIKTALFDADVPYDVANAFIEQVKVKAIGTKLKASLNPSQQFIKIFHEQLISFLGVNDQIQFSFQIPSITMVMGLQGSGKTTTIAKMARLIQQRAAQKGKKRSILFASVDFYRPAAIEQLEILAKQLGVDFYRARAIQPVEAAREILHHYKNGQYDHLFFDTAGRLHVDQAMLEELKFINFLVNPVYKFLVLDAMTGQESLRVAQAFDAVVPFTHALLTKMDSETKGGAALAFRYILKKPILFIGTGEKLDDLEQFYPDRIAQRILGMGDILTLIEQTEQKHKTKEQEKAAQAFTSGKMTLQDFLQQLEMVSSMGSFSKIARYLPGVVGKISDEQLMEGERELKKFKAIIGSMTLKERIFPKILDASRKERVAKGSGTTTVDVNILLKRFEESQQFVKLLKNTKNFPNLFS